MAHVTNLGFTMGDLDTAVQDGQVRRQTHPEFPDLHIYNYTEEVQFKNRWNRITLACRGLILNQKTGEVIARPWEKFFNFGQMDNRIDSDAPVEVTDKMDGSLGILYRRPDGQHAIATRGSFASEQAAHGTEVLEEEYLVWINQNAVDEYTFLFEIIYPDNRIVCDYDGMDDLVLLGAVHNEQGYYVGPGAAGGLLNWHGPVTEVWHFDRFVDALSFPDRKGKEGVVIRSGNKIVKLKQADYVELHRIVTNLSPKTIWEMLSRGMSQTDICSDIPDEFHQYVRDIADELYVRFANIKVEALIDFQQIKGKLWEEKGSEISRRAWAQEIKKNKNSGLLFNLLDEKPIDSVVWQMVKPRGDIKTLVEDEG